MHYPTYWRLSAFLALVFHFFLWTCLTFIIPYLAPEPKPMEAMEVVDISDIEGDGEGEPGIEGEPEPEAEPEPPAPEPLPEPPPVDESAPPPVLTDDELKAVEEIEKEEKEEEKKPEKPKRSNIVKRSGGTGGAQMAEGPRLIEDYYPSVGGANFRGRVMVKAVVSKEGKVIDTKIMVSSGKRLVDQIAMNAARKWTYRPALDQHGQPMECWAMISIPFNVENVERQRRRR